MLAKTLCEHRKFKWAGGMRWVVPTEGGAPNHVGTVTADTVMSVPKNAVPVLDDPATAGVLSYFLTLAGGAVLWKEYEIKARAPNSEVFFSAESDTPGVSIAKALLETWDKG